MLHIIVPARFASVRLAGKPLVSINGIPLIERVYRSLEPLTHDHPVQFAIDDPTVAEFLSARKIPHRMTDPSHQSGTDRIAEVAEKLSLSPDDVVVNLQGDEPLLPEDLLRNFIDFCSRDDLRMATISAPITSAVEFHNPNVVKVVTDMRGKATYFSRFPIPFQRDTRPGDENHSLSRRHVGVYAYRVATLKKLSSLPVSPTEQAEKLEQLRAIWHGISINVMEWHTCPPHGVDSPEDVERVSKIFEEMERE